MSEHDTTPSEPDDHGPPSESEAAPPEPAEPGPLSGDEPTAPEDGEATSPEKDEPGPRFRLIVAVLIAIVSVLGAGVAWSAASSSNNASNLDQSAQQEFLLRQQILTSARASVGEDLRRVADFQEQVTAEHVLRQQAERFQKTQPSVAAVLDQQAQGDAALARTTGALFFAAAPTVSADGTVNYDRKQAMSNLLSQYVIYQQLHPGQTQAAANKAVRKYRQVVAVGVLFVAALFFLTVAEFARRRIRHTVVGFGVLALVAGCVLWPLTWTGAL